MSTSTAPVSGEAYPVRLQASESEDIRNDRFLTCRFDFRSADIDTLRAGSLEIDPVAHSASVRFAVRAAAAPCTFHLYFSATLMQRI